MDPGSDAASKRPPGGPEEAARSLPRVPKGPPRGPQDGPTRLSNTTNHPSDSHPVKQPVRPNYACGRNAVLLCWSSAAILFRNRPIKQAQSCSNERNGHVNNSGQPTSFVRFSSAQLLNYDCSSHQSSNHTDPTARWMAR
eukprot:11222063-Lingulodinium_polyedra.AAC.1